MVTSLLSVLALVSVIVAHKLDPFVAIPVVRRMATAALAVFAVVSLVAPEAAGVGSSWLVDQYAAEARELTTWLTQIVFESFSEFAPSTTTTPAP